MSAFDHLVRRCGDAPLVATPGRRASVAEVDALARSLADHLSAAGLEPGTPVPTAAPDGPAFFAAFLALRRLRLVPVLLDQRSPAPERERVSAELGCARCLVVEEAWPSGAEAWRLASCTGEDGDPGAGCPPGFRLEPEIAAVKLSSGSTGRPRGVLTPTETLLADDDALARTMGLAPDERILSALPLSHSYALSSVVLPALVRGSVVVMAEPGSGPLGALRAARELEATFFPTVPAFLGALVSSGEPPALSESVRLTISAGAPLPPETAERFRRAYGRPVHAFYGSSETGGICFDREGGAGERGSVGEPVEGVRVELAAVEEGTAPGDVGVVSVESDAVATSYWPVPDHHLCAGRFRTGDLARWKHPAGRMERPAELVLLGRVDDLINVRGKKVDPREVERVLARLPGVREAVALGMPCAARGETVVRAVVAADAEAVSPRAVADWCRRHLADHKVPRSVVVVDEIPRTPRGKVDRERLRSLEPNPGFDRPTGSGRRRAAAK